MKVVEIVKDKTIKRLEKRSIIVEAILNKETVFAEIVDAVNSLHLKEVSLLLESIEEASRSNDFKMEEKYLYFAEKYILADDNSCRREASHIVGNLAHKYPDSLKTAIDALLLNTKDEGTVSWMPIL